MKTGWGLAFSRLFIFHSSGDCEFGHQSIKALSLYRLGLAIRAPGAGFEVVVLG